MKLLFSVIVAIAGFLPLMVQGTGEELVAWCYGTAPAENRVDAGDYGKCLTFLSAVVEANEMLSTYEMNSIAHSERKYTFFCNPSVSAEQLRQVFLEWTRLQLGLNDLEKGNVAVRAFRAFWPCQ